MALYPYIQGLYITVSDKSEYGLGNPCLECQFMQRKPVHTTMHTGGHRHRQPILWQGIMQVPIVTLAMHRIRLDCWRGPLALLTIKLGGNQLSFTAGDPANVIAQHPQRLCTGPTKGTIIGITIKLNLMNTIQISIHRNMNRLFFQNEKPYRFQNPHFYRSAHVIPTQAILKSARYDAGNPYPTSKYLL
jgi:hypothetical protein